MRGTFGAKYPNERFADRNLFADANQHFQTHGGINAIRYHAAAAAELSNDVSKHLAINSRDEPRLWRSPVTCGRAGAR
jgi:hypothetical protein